MSASFKAPPLTEKEFQQQVTELAEILGWAWAHFRPAQTAHGWRTPVSGSLGAGFPDLILCRPGKTLFAELKRDGVKATIAQEIVHAQLREAGNDVRVWRPADWDAVVACLNGEVR